MDALEVLFLEDSRISGSLAGTDGWPSLGELDVSNDMLSGGIPGSLFQHLKLAVMDLHGNFFSQNFPQPEALVSFVSTNGRDTSRYLETVDQFSLLDHFGQ
jgi:hypothetical protein